MALEPTNKEITNQINNVTSINQNPNQNSNATNYFNLILGAQIAQQLTKFNASDGFNFSNVSVLVMLLSITELQTLAKSVFCEISSTVKIHYKPVFMSIYNGFNNFGCFIYKNRFGLKLFTNKQSIKLPEYNLNITPEPNQINEFKYDINITIDFMQGFVNFLNLQNEKKTFNIKNYKNIYIEDMKTDKITEEYENIVIEYDGIKIYLENKLVLKFLNVSNKKKLIEVNSIGITENSSQINKLTIKYIHQLIDDQLVSGMLNLLIDEIDFKSSNSDKLSELELYNQVLKLQINKKFDNGCLARFYNKNNESELSVGKYILLILKFNYSDLKLDDSYIQLLYLLNWIQNIYNLDVKSFFVKNNKLYFLDLILDIPQFLMNMKISKIFAIYDGYFDGYFDYHINGFKGEGLKKYLINMNTMFYKGINKMLKYSPEIIVKYLSAPIQHENDAILQNYISTRFVTITTSKSLCGFNNDIIVNDIITKKNTKKTTETTEIHKKIKFYCYGNFTESIIDTKFDDFLKKIKSLSFMSNVSEVEITINKLKLHKNETTIEKPNQLYIDYENKKQFLNELANKSTSTITNTTNQIEIALSEFIKEQIPSKVITSIETNKIVQTEFIRSDYKSLDTLYLQEKDELKLKNVLMKFHLHKDKLKSLGLPNKLCIMLDGKPGTGKTSTILAIGSFLKKPIYYTSFNTIETNDELQMLVDHVIKNCNGGIIVCEDIDAIGKFVHRRNNYDTLDCFTEHNSTQIMDSKFDKLSLEYFLNLLQGTLTPNELIFICTTNYIDKLDPALIRHGRMDVRITMKNCDRYQFNKIYKNFIGREIPFGLLNKISENKFTPAQVIFTIKDFISEIYTDEEILSDFL